MQLTPLKSNQRKPMNTTTRLTLAALLALFASTPGHSLLGQSLVTIAASNFDDTNIRADGWLGKNNLNGAETLTYNTGGATANSVGYISVSETTGDDATMYFAAPAKFLGDKHTAYNGFLRFNFKQSATTNLYGSEDVVLLGSTSLQLSFRLRSVPSTSWGFFEIPLVECVGWFNVTSHRLATRDDIYTVLKAVTKLWIRAEYSSNNFDRGDLDNVELLGQPTGPTLPTLSIARYAGLTIDGEVGASYRIEYSDALDIATNWLKLADVILPSTPYLFIDQTSPGASSRFYRAVLNP